MAMGPHQSRAVSRVSGLRTRTNIRFVSWSLQIESCDGQQRGAAPQERLAPGTRPAASRPLTLVLSVSSLTMPMQRLPRFARRTGRSKRRASPSSSAWKRPSTRSS